MKVNLLLRDFIKPAPPPRRWVRGRSRRKRALYISSPIGLGHAQRDVAIADELRKLHPDLEIDWLAQHPVTRVLQAAGERIHPASALLSNESSHIESESAEHDLHCFQAIRRMDEILLSNFMPPLPTRRNSRYRPPMRVCGSATYSYYPAARCSFISAVSWRSTRTAMRAAPVTLYVGQHPYSPGRVPA